MPDQHDYLVVDGGEVAGTVSTTGLRSVRRRSRRAAALGDVLRANTLATFPDERVHDALEKMTNAPQTVIAVLDGESGRFLGSLTSHDVIDLVVLMNEIETELKQMGSEEV